MAAGRPTKYDASMGERARKLALLGMTDAEVADILGVSRDTLNEWDRVHPEFSDIRARGKIEADTTVAASLYHRANGYSHKAVKIFMPAGADEPVYAEYIEHFPPDTMAASLWLRNRQPEKWKDRTEQKIESDINVHRVLAEKPMTEAEWTEVHAIEGPKDAT